MRSPGVSGTQSARWEDGNRTDLEYQDQLRRSSGDHQPSSRAQQASTRPQLPLRQRVQPVPFILPRPLGPLPSPTGSNFQVIPATSRESTPRAFAPPEAAYPWSNHHIKPEPERPDAGSAYYAPPAATPYYPSFPPESADFTWRQSPGALTPPSSGGLTPPAHACPPPPPRRDPATGPAFSHATARTPSMPAPGPFFPECFGQPVFPPAPPPEARRFTPPGSVVGGGGLYTPAPKDLVLQYRCDQCQGVFASAGGLKRHKRTHATKHVTI